MLRNAASKVAWVGRTASMVFGLALVMALLFGVASVGLAANGKPFILGKATNTATKVTGLIGKVATGSSLFVSNPSGGSALGLQVNAGQAPLTVNADAGKATNLDADKLDGKEASEFYASGSKVDDSAHADQADNATNAANSNTLDGKDSSEFASAYKRTVVVSPTGTDLENGTALTSALSGITDASASKPYLLYIEPGTYDLGNGSLAMRQHVDIQGAGELKTIITSTLSSCSSGTVEGASNAELRFLTVRNTGRTTGGCNAAIRNTSASPRLTHVTTESTGGTGGGDHIGVWNVSSSNPTMTNVTATTSGGNFNNTGVFNFNTGVFNDSSHPTMTDVSATASGGFVNRGVLNVSSSPTIRHSSLSGTNASLAQQGGGTAKVALTQLVGPISKASGSTLQCFDNYDGNMAPVSCP